jgi:hypothetical protein
VSVSGMQPLSMLDWKAHGCTVWRGAHSGTGRSSAILSYHSWLVRYGGWMMFMPWYR